MTPIGPATYGRFMNVRVFDFWVHQRDMTMPLGIDTKDDGVHAEITLDEVHGSLGYIAGKKNRFGRWHEYCFSTFRCD